MGFAQCTPPILVVTLWTCYGALQVVVLLLLLLLPFLPLPSTLNYTGGHRNAVKTPSESKAEFRLTTHSGWVHLIQFSVDCSV